MRRISEESGFEQQVWQFPVITIPFGTEEAPDSVVLRPIHSVDGMTAQSVEIPPEILRAMTSETHGRRPDRGRVLRPDPQAAGHDRVGVARRQIRWKPFRMSRIE